MSVLCVTGCSVQRTSTSADTQIRVESSTFRDSVRVESVAVSDSVVEVTTVTIRENEQGDTLRMSTVTDRTRIRERERARDVEVKAVEKHDTVYIEQKDSIRVQEFHGSSDQENRASPFTRAVKWLVALVVAICILVIIIKVKV